MALQLWVRSDIEDWDEIDRLIDAIRNEFDRFGEGGRLVWSVRGEEIFGQEAYAGIPHIPEMGPAPSRPLMIYGEHQNLLWDRIDNLYNSVRRAVQETRQQAELRIEAIKGESILPE